MHPGHSEIKREEHLCLLRHIRGKRLFLQAIRVRIDELRDIKVSARNVVLLPLLVVLVILDAKEHESKQSGNDKEENKQTLLPDLSRPYPERHKKTGADQHGRVRRPQWNAELV